MRWAPDDQIVRRAPLIRIQPSPLNHSPACWMPKPIVTNARESELRILFGIFVYLETVNCLSRTEPLHCTSIQPSARLPSQKET
jgi:hypothetical protein